MNFRGRGGSFSDWDPMRDDFNDSSFNAQYPEDTSEDQLDPLKLYVTKMPPALTEEALVDLFSKYGNVVHSYYSKDVQKKYAIIAFETAGQARLAMMKLNKTEPFGMSVIFAKKRTQVSGRTSQPNVDRSRSSTDRPVARHSISMRQNINNEEDFTSFSSKGRITRNAGHSNGNLDEDEVEGIDLSQDPQLGYDLEKIKLQRLEIMDSKLEVQQRMLIREKRLKLNASLPTRRRLLSDGRSIQITQDTSIIAGGGDSRNIPRLQHQSSRRCVSCGAAAELYCAGCRVTPYCTEHCQRRDWDARHRAVCHNLARASVDEADNHVSPLPAPDISSMAPPRRTHAPTKAPNMVPTSDSGSDRSNKKFIPPSEKHAAFQEVQARHGNYNKNYDRRGGPVENGAHHNNIHAFNNRRHTPNQHQPLRQPKQLTSEAARLQPKELSPEPARRQPIERTPEPARLQPIERTPEPARHQPKEQTPEPARLQPIERTPEPARLQPKERTSEPFRRQPKELTPEPARPTRLEPTPPEPKPEFSKPSVIASRLGTTGDVTPRKPLVPAAYVVEKLSVGVEFLVEVVALASECGSKQFGCVCLTLHEDYSEMYDLICEGFEEHCERDNEVYTPRIGETFAYLCEEDRSWYRTRCLARTRGALLDAGRVVSLSPSGCRRLPPSFAAIPEFMALLKTTDLAIGSNLSCKVISSSCAGVTVSVEDGTTCVRVEATRWIPEIHADEPQNLQSNLKQLSPEPPTTKPSQVEPSRKVIQPHEPKEPQVAESRPRSSVISRLTKPTALALVPANYVVERLSVGAEFVIEVVALASECGSKQFGCVCLTLHEDYSEMYSQICEDFVEYCEKDNEVYTPSIGETFAYKCDEDMFWYRARCLARTRGALLDAGRVVSLSPSQCRRLPPSFATIPEFMAVLKKNDLAIGSNLSCKVIRSTSAAITVSVEDGTTCVQVEVTRWTPDIESTEEPQHSPLRQPNLKQPTPEPQTTKPAEVEPSPRKPRAAPVESRPNSISSRLNREVTSKPLVPANYLVEKLPVGAEFLAQTVAVTPLVGSKQLGCVCLTLHEDYGEMYERLCEDFEKECLIDNEVYTPSIGETFAYLCEEDGFWYRARCLARTRGALLDAGRVVSLLPSACRRLPESFATIPEFMAVLSIDIDIGNNLTCKVVSSSDSAITVSVKTAEAYVQVQATRWTPEIEYTHKPVAAPKSIPVSLPTPVASTPAVSKQSATVPEVPRPALEHNTLYTLLDVTSLRRACVRPSDPRPAAAFDAVLQDTVLYGVDAKPLKEPPQKGQTVVAKFIEDGTHYRALVKRVNVAMNKYLIEYIEYGNEEIVPLERLYPCPPKLQLDVKPAQASIVKLSDREPVTLSPAAIQYIDTLKENVAELILTVPGGVKAVPSGSLVMLLLAKNCEPVSKKIEDLCIPEWKKLVERGGDVLEMEPRFFSDLKYSNIPTNRPFILRVTYCDASQLMKGTICGYEKGNKAAELVYGELTNQITEYCASALCKEPYLPKIEEMCIAENSLDGAWARSVLIKLPRGAGSLAASVLHVDCGRVEDVPVAALRRAPPALVDAYPALANHLEIKGFPQDGVSIQQVERAMRFMKITPQGTGELRVNACRVIDENLFEVDAPELIAIFTQ